MFEIGWSELLVIGVVLIVVVGPKDLPRMLRTFGRTTSQLRRMAGDFRRQFDDALREAEMEDVRDTVRDIKAMDPRSDIRKAMNPIRAVGDEIRSSLRTAAKAPEPVVPSATQGAQPTEPPVVMAPRPPMPADQPTPDPLRPEPVRPDPVPPAVTAAGEGR